MFRGAAQKRLVPGLLVCNQKSQLRSDASPLVQPLQLRDPPLHEAVGQENCLLSLLLGRNRIRTYHENVGASVAELSATGKSWEMQWVRIVMVSFIRSFSEIFT